MSDQADPAHHARGLAIFRIVFGLFMMWPAFRYLQAGWVHELFIEPQIYITYPGFSWVKPWPGEWMLVHFWLMGIAAACVALGLAYRFTMPLFCALWTYVFLLDQANYLNHYYLLGLLAFLLCFMPANRVWSLDRRLGWAKGDEDVAAHWLWLLRFQVGVAYVFGAVAKLNGDWLRGEPMRTWLNRDTDLPLLNPLLHSELAPWFMSYGGLVFDALIVPALMWRRTRYWAFIPLVFFHLMNAVLFDIRIFPWFMLAATVVFFDFPARGPPLPAPGLRRYQLTAALVVAWVFLQCAIPFRHLLYPSNVQWSCEGGQFAWHMKLYDKVPVFNMTATDPATGETFVVDTRALLTAKQHYEMSVDPFQIQQFAKHVAARFAREGRPGLQLRVNAFVALNGRPQQRLIDPNVDLAAEPYPLGPARFIEPLFSRR